MGSLRSFIKDIRAAKTLSEERSIITKESAKIRTKLKDIHLPFEKRRKNIHKLLYLYILGEKTHFAQVECINLIVSEDFADKRLGYLAAVLLLDENQELLTLLTNILNNDLNSSNRYIVALALNTLGALTSPELARDLYSDVKNILSHSKDSFILKKALQCAAKIVQRDASLLDVFYPYVSSILSNRDGCTHGVLLGITKLLQSIIDARSRYEFDNFDEILSELSSTIPELISILQTLSSTNYNPEFDVNGSCDPFLQVEIMFTLCQLFQTKSSQTQKYQDKFSDVLIQIATNTESVKNSGNSILYETTRTIFSLQLDPSLRVLGINILAKFLSGKDNNTKYVALNTLLQVVLYEPQAVQRHKKFILRCLHDVDVSIKIRALELTFAILDELNMKDLVNELISFLKLTTEDDRDLIIYTVEHLINLFDIREVSDANWKMDTMVCILKIVGQYIKVDKIDDILILINNTSNIEFKTQKVKEILESSLTENKENISKENICWKLMTVWIIGEYAQLVIGADLITAYTLTEYLYNLNNMHGRDVKLISYILTAALKLSWKLDDSRSIEKLRQLIKKHTRDTNLIIQTKAVQYGILFVQPLEIKKSILDTMPSFQKTLKGMTETSTSTHKTTTTHKKKESSLLDLLSDISSLSPQSDSQPTNNSVDVLSEIFLHSDIGGHPSNFQSKSQSASIPSNAIAMYSSPYLQVFGEVVSCNNGSAVLDLFFQAKSAITDLHILTAVGKTQTLTIGQLSHSYICKNGISKQRLSIQGEGRLKLKVKLQFNGNIDQQFNYKFDQSL